MSKHFVNEEDFNWIDISNEVWRKYHFPNGVEFTIMRPRKVHVSHDEVYGDSHRVIAETTDGQPVAFYVRRGWLSIEWMVHNKSKVVEF